jgi:microcystin-dependent protein
MDAFVGTVQSYAFPFAPRGWQKCRGQIISVAQQTALFSLIGTIYGGDGQTTFKLPDLSGRNVLGDGHLLGGDEYAMGEMGGREQVTLQDSQMPRHTHGLVATDASAESATPGPGLILGKPSDASGNDINIYAPRDKGTRGPLAPDSIGLSGMSQPLSLMQPFLTMSYCICRSPQLGVA